VRVLIVEDDPATRDVLVRGFREEGFQVNAAGDGASAVEIAAAQSFDVILLDLVLPGRDGLAVCRQLRARSVDTPILLLTGRQTLQDRVRGLDAGADDYVGKPFAFEEVLARVRALTRRGRTRALDTVLRYGPLELDQRSHVVKLNGAVVALRETEFRLLEYFLRHPEVLVTRAALADSVWGRGTADASNVVEVYISYLRRKLKPAGRRLLHTVRGGGYMLRDDGQP
jgi:two-component system response regulator MprA